MAKILVADDNSNIQKMVGLALKDQGIDVVAVGNGEAAVRKISDIRPDLVLADVFMPVRNGYEVCNYVKQDAALSHIPVILLVGAFDPLDEQEAQRVGADGVLKKPFVPPDPLISMVKSALTRAGVVLGAPAPEPAAAAPPPPPPPPRVAPPPPPIPVAAEPEPEFSLPTFSSRPAPISINKGEQPLAFGSLLDTPAPEEEIFTAPAAAAAPERDWGHQEEQEEEVEEEESKTGSWRLSTMDELPNEVPAGQKDWREAAFAGIGTGNGDKAFKEWAPSVEKNSLSITEQEAADLAKKQELLGAPVVTGAEDWSKAISDIFPEKPVAVAPPPPPPPAYYAPAATTEPAAPSVIEPVPAPPVPEPVLAAPAPVASASASAPEPSPTLNSPALNSWMAGAVSPWESELQRANDLASSWDAAKLVPAALVEDADATQAFLDSGLLATAHEHVVETIEEVKAAETHVVEPEVSSFAPSPVESLYSPAEHQVEEEVSTAAPVAHEEAAIVIDAVVPEAIEAPAEIEAPVSAYAAEPLTAPEPVVSPAVEPAATSAPAANANMDELVAKVLAKMNPDALQAVTREILKPVIEALVREELNKK